MWVITKKTFQIVLNKLTLLRMKTLIKNVKIPSWVRKLIKFLIHVTYVIESQTKVQDKSQ